MSKTLILICLIFLSVSPAYARNHFSRGNDFLRGYNFDREISQFRRVRERGFRISEDREFGRIWRVEHREGTIFLGIVNGINYSIKHEAYQYYQLGIDDLHQHNYVQAIVEFTKAIDTYPEFSAAYRFRGVAYYRLNKFDEAIADTYKADQLGSTDSSSFINMIKEVATHQGAIASFQLGLNDLRQQNFTQAITEFNKALETYPDMRGAYYCRGIAYYRLKQFSKALADVNKAAELGFPIHHDLVIAIRDSDNLPLTILDLTLAINIDPDNEKLYYRRGLFYKRQQNYIEAIADETKAIQLNPNDGNAYRTRGASYYGLKNYNDAWTDVTKAQALGAHVKPELINNIKQALKMTP